MASRSTTGGMHDFVDSDDLSSLEGQLGRHAPLMGSRHLSFWKRIKKLFGK